MSYLKHSSWGRTRGPKAAIPGQNSARITGSATIHALNALDVGANPDNATAANGVYVTENQRYAHITCSGSTTVTNVYLYTYASNMWHELVTGSANSSVVVAPWSHQIVDINGADMISLSSGSGVQHVTMAFSTF